MNIHAIIALPLADFEGHMDWDGGWGILMVLGMILFWGLVIAAFVWVVRELSGSRGRSAAAADPLAILDRRLAEGALSPEEYRERREILAGKDPAEN